MAKITFPIFLEDDGLIFRVSKESGFLVADKWDKESRTFKRIKVDMASFLFDTSTKSLDPNDLPSDIKEAIRS